MDVFQATAAIRSYPPDTGGYQRTHGLMKAFPDFDDSVSRYCCTGPLATYYADGEFISSSVEFGPDFVEERHYSLLHDVRKIMPLLGLPGFLWPVVFNSWVGDEIVQRASGCDVAIADHPFLALFLADNSDVPTVYSSHNVEYERYLSTADGPLTEWFGSYLRNVEERAARRAEAVVCTTESDRQEFAKHNHSAFVIPNGVSEERVDTQAEPTDRAAYDIPESAVVGVFLGSDYGPNVEAAEWLVNNWPLLDDEHHLLVLGDSGDGIEATADNVHTTGYVEDLDGALTMADIALNPISAGGGSNVKLIEYFAARLPVVSTPFGARGFDVAHEEHLLLADRAEFLDAVRELGANEARRDTLRENGYSLAAEEYTWESLSARFRDELARFEG